VSRRPSGAVKLNPGQWVPVAPTSHLINWAPLGQGTTASSVPRALSWASLIHVQLLFTVSPAHLLKCQLPHASYTDFTAYFPHDWLAVLHTNYKNSCKLFSFIAVAQICGRVNSYTAISSTTAVLQRVQNAASRLGGASWTTWSRDPDFEKPSLAVRRTANCVQSMSADASTSHRKSTLLSSKLCHCISWLHFSSLSALRLQSMIRTAAHVSEESSFSCAGPKAWNSLPPSLQELTNTSTFRRNLKAFLFQQTGICLLMGIVSMA